VSRGKKWEGRGREGGEKEEEKEEQYGKEWVSRVIT